MADLFRDSPFGQIMRIYFLREMAPFEDEKKGFQLEKTLKQASSDSDEDEKGTTRSDEEEIEEKQKSSDGSQTGEQSGYRKQSFNDSESDGASDGASGHHDNTRLRPPAPEHDKIVEFMGPKDEDNPQNWSLAKKLFVFGQVCFLTLAIYTGSAIVTPAEQIFMEKFGANEQEASLPLSMYVLGYGIGPLLFSPLSEVPDLGRNVSYMSSFFIFIILVGVSSAVNNYPGFVVLRLLQGFFGGPVLATGSASAQDLFAFHKVPYAIATWAVFVWAGPALGPVVSGFATVLTPESWRWGMWELLMLSFGTFLVLFFCLPETNAEYILGQRAKRLRVLTGDHNIKTKAERDSADKQWSGIVWYHLVMPCKINALDPSILFINVYTALMYSIYYSFFESFPLVYKDIYNFKVPIVGLMYLAVLLGGLIGMTMYTIIVRMVYEPYTLKHGVENPEWRLFPAVWGAVFLAASLFIFGYAAKADISWVAPTVGVVMFAISAFLNLNSIFVYLPMGYPRYAASVFASNGLFRSLLATAAIHFAHPLFNNLGVGNGCALLGGIGALCAVLFLGLYKYGATLRARSKFGG